MPSIQQFSGWGQLARVRGVYNQQRIFLQLSNGQVGWIDTSEPVSFTPGTTIHIVDDRIEPVPDDVWVEEPWVATVKIKRPDFTVVEFGGQAKLLPTNSVEYSQGNTVEASTAGVLRVLDENPIRIIDLPDIDERTVEHFIVKREVGAPGFADFGGLPDVVKRAQRLIETPLKYGEYLTRIGARQVKGVLFTGSPGTGKTMLARIIAEESQATFYSVSGPEIVSKWYGQSEELLRLLFDHAKEQPSAIIFFDEIDSIAIRRDEDAHEASRRLVAQLLTLMDGFKGRGNVVVIAATNRPDGIDPALRRPGRFDWEINFPLPGRQDREAILLASAHRLQTLEPLPYSRVADLTEGWTAAELAEIWTEAAMLAAIEKRDVILTEDFIGGFEAIQKQRGRISGEVAE